MDLESMQYSLNKHLHDNFTTAVIRYEDVPSFDARKHGEWVEPYIAGPTGVATSHGQDHVRMLIVVKAFSRIDINGSGNRRNLYRAAELLDEIVTLLEKKDIIFQTTSGSYLGSIRIGEPSVVNLGIEEDLKGVSAEFPAWVIRST